MEPGELKLGETDHNKQAEKSNLRLNWLYQALIAKGWRRLQHLTANCVTCLYVHASDALNIPTGLIRPARQRTHPFTSGRIYTNVIVE